MTAGGLTDGKQPRERVVAKSRRWNRRAPYTLPPNWVFAAGPFPVILGVFVRYVSDAQKFYTAGSQRTD
jgi:hypothetical protein